MQALQKLHISNRLYIEQVTCHFLILLLSARACSETVKRNLVRLEISFGRSLSLMETSQLMYTANRLTDFFVMREVRGLRVFCRFLDELPLNMLRLRFLRNFHAGELGGVSVF